MIERVNLNECNSFEEVTARVNDIIDEVNALSFVHELSDEVKQLSKSAKKKVDKAEEKAAKKKPQK